MTLMLIASNILTLVLVLPVLFGGSPIEFAYNNSNIELISFAFKIDSFAAFFICIISLISLACAIFSFKYTDQYKKEYSLTRLGFLVNLFVLSMVGVIASDRFFSFLVFWELMSLSSYYLVIFEHKKEDNLKAGLIYFVMTHIATAFLIVAFLLIANQTGEYSFAAFKMLGQADNQSSIIIFLMFFVGTAIKMGLLPFHFWLPLAHPAAPSHVSALMSGVMVKTALYLLFRVTYNLLPCLGNLAYLILAFGLISALFGVIYSLIETDIKKILAYSTIENMGVCLVGLGLSVLYYNHGAYVFSSIAFVASLFHALNHSIYKSLLFLGAGAIVSKTHTRNINYLGGLIHKMPNTAIFVLLGSLSISAIPFFNGFISEWLLYQSMIRPMQINSLNLHFVLPLSLMLLAIVGGLVIVAFLRFFGISFVGAPRSQAASKANEVSKCSLFALGVLAIACLFIGLYPQVFNNIWVQLLSDFHLLSDISFPFYGLEDASLVYANSGYYYFVPLIVMIVSLMLFIVVLLFSSMFKTKFRKAIAWNCGHEQTSQMEYTGSAFSQPFLRLMGFIYKPKLIKEIQTFNKSEYLIEKITFRKEIKHYPDDSLYKAIEMFKSLVKLLTNKLHSGNLQSYLMYILVTLIGALIYVKYF